MLNVEASVPLLYAFKEQIKNPINLDTRPYFKKMSYRLFSGLFQKLGITASEVKETGAEEYRLPTVDKGLEDQFDEVDINSADELAATYTEFDHIYNRMNTEFAIPHAKPEEDQIIETPYPGVHVIGVYHTLVTGVRKNMPRHESENEPVLESGIESGTDTNNVGISVNDTVEPDDPSTSTTAPDTPGRVVTAHKAEYYIVASRNTALYQFAVSQEISMSRRITVSGNVDNYYTSGRRRKFFDSNRAGIAKFLAGDTSEFEYFEIDNCIVQAFSVVEAWIVARSTLVSALTLGAGDLPDWARNILFSHHSLSMRGMFNQELALMDALYAAKNLTDEINSTSFVDGDLGEYKKRSSELSVTLAQYESHLKRYFERVPGIKYAEDKFDSENADLQRHTAYITKRNHSKPPPSTVAITPHVTRTPKPTTVTTTTTQSFTTELPVSSSSPVFKTPFQTVTPNNPAHMLGFSPGNHNNIPRQQQQQNTSIMKEEMSVEDVPHKQVVPVIEQTQSSNKQIVSS